MEEHTPKSPPHSNTRVIAALLAGMAYGLLLRIGFEAEALGSFFQIVSTAFLLVTPFSVGAIAVLVAAGKQPITIRRQLAVSTITMLLFLVAMFLTLLEGLICIVLVAPVFLVAAILGGLLAGWLNNHFRASKTTLSSMAILPLLVAPLEANLPPMASMQTVSNTIFIQASPEQVFDQLASVRDISADELGFSFVHLIGLPKPIEASMNGAGVGAIRTSRWEKDVQFQEVITTWQRPAALHYQFYIPPGSIPRAALDRHVELGGEYFTVLDGGYDLTARDGGTELRLTTRFLNKSQLKVYGDIWGQLVLADFHDSILGLMKHRAENVSR